MVERNEYFEKFKQGLQECIDFENGDMTTAREIIYDQQNPTVWPSEE